MAERLTTKLKGLFRSDDDKKQDQPLARGVPSSRDELVEWVSKPSFADLPPRGREAFFRYLRGGKYDEDEDIEKVSPEAPGMCNNSRRYQFWLKCKQFDLNNLFKVYVADADTMLPDVRKCYNDFKKKEENADKTEPEFVKEKENDVEKASEFFSDLSDRAKVSLDQEFIAFQEYLRKEYSDKSP